MGKKIVNWHKNGGLSVVFKGKVYNYPTYIKFRICPTYIFIVDCLSPFYSALYFQGPRSQK